jgi:hypothetical protein
MAVSPVRNITSIESKALTKKVQSIPSTPFIFRSIKATGSEAGIIQLSKDISKIQSKINLLYYGDKTNKNKGIKFPFKKEKINGILPLLNEINKIDFCNIVAYILNNTKLENQPGSSNTVTLLKSKAKEVLPIIDEILLSNVNINTNTISIGDIVIITEDISFSNILDIKGNVIKYDVNDKITIEDETVLNTLRRNPRSYTKANNKFKQVLIKLRNSIQVISSITDDPDVISLVPQLTQSNNFIKDFNRKLDKNITVESIPTEEIQTIISQIKKVRTILALIVGINSFRDALGAVQTATGLNIGRQEDRLQKSINIDKLIPIIKVIINSVDVANQMGQKILKFIKIILIYIKIQTIILKVLRKIVKLFNKLPLPLAFVMFGVTSTIEGGKTVILKQIDDRLDRLSQLNSIVELVYLTVQNITVKFQYINTQLQILQNNMQVCNQTDNSPIIDELNASRKRILKTIEDLDKFSNKYDEAINLNQNIFGGYILKIQEEEIVDGGIKYKRRRGIALDSNGILVEQTDLTFATDTNIIIEELKLKLNNKGLVQSTGNTDSGYPDLDELSKDITIDTDISDTEDDNENNAEYISIQNELNTMIDTIKGATKLKKKVKQNINKEVNNTKDNIKQGSIPQEASSVINNTINSTVQTINKGTQSTTNSSDILIDSERIKLEQELIKLKELSLRAGPLSIQLINDKIIVIQSKLEKDKKARGEI